MRYWKEAMLAGRWLAFALLRNFNGKQNLLRRVFRAFRGKIVDLGTSTAVRRRVGGGEADSDTAGPEASLAVSDPFSSWFLAAVDEAAGSLSAVHESDSVDALLQSRKQGGAAAPPHCLSNK